LVEISMWTLAVWTEMYVVYLGTFRLICYTNLCVCVGYECDTRLHTFQNCSH